ncbi:MAG: hypothetical protein WCK98_05540 [bacterium]
MEDKINSATIKESPEAIDDLNLGEILKVLRDFNFQGIITAIEPIFKREFKTLIRNCEDRLEKKSRLAQSNEDHSTIRVYTNNLNLFKSQVQILESLLTIIEWNEINKDIDQEYLSLVILFDFSQVLSTLDQMDRLKNIFLVEKFYELEIGGVKKV